MAERVFLLTRDFAASSRLQNQLTHKSVIFPLSRTEKLNIDLTTLDDYAALIMTSQNAFSVRDLDFWQRINKTKKLYIVGENFAEKLSAAGLNNFEFFQTAQKLANALKKKPEQKLLYLRGDKISFDLKEALGNNLQQKICYETSYFPLDRNDLFDFIKENKVTDLLFISKFNAERFRGLLADKIDFNKYNIYCFSKRIAELFADYSKQVKIPKEPTIKELLRII